MEESFHPNPKLLSLVDKMSNPIGSCKITFDVQGIFAFPDDWKVPDGQNPAESMFQYKVSYHGVEVLEGIF